MATSRCPVSECGSTSFELKTFEPHGSSYKLSAIQCRTCGAIVGVMDYFNIGNLVHQLAKAFGKTL